MKHAPLLLVSFAAGMIVGCTTAAVVAQQDDAPAPETTTSGDAPRFVIGPSDADTRVAPSGKATAMRYVSGEEAYVGTLSMGAGAGVPEHADPTEEFIYVLSGSGTITIDGASFDIAPKTLVYMPAGATVSYQNGDEPLEALQVFANPGPESKYDAWGAKP